VFNIKAVCTVLQMQSLQDELRQWQKESNKSQKDLKRLETDATNKSKKIEELNEEVSSR